MALSKQLTVKRQRTGIPDSVKKRVILQDDDDQPVPARPLLEDQRRALAGQQSLVLSPPRHSTVVDKSVLAEARTDIASLKDKVPVGKEEVGRLVTVIGQHQHVIRIKARERQFTIGRHRSADFIIDSPAVSNVHGKVFAHTCDTGDTLVCYEDVSRAGTLYNDEILLNKEAVILSHGDTVLIDDREFFYFHFATRNLDQRLSEEDFWSQDTKEAFPRHVGQYRITERTLGSGSYAVVHLAIDRTTGRQMACKVLHKKMMAQRRNYDKIEQEVRILTELSHNNILSFMDACHDGDNWYLMLELCIGGDLHSYVARKNKLNGSEALFITYQLLLAMEVIHCNLRDLDRAEAKPLLSICTIHARLLIEAENILLRTRGPYPHVLISDFATVTREPMQPDIAFVGTLDYWSPECFTGSHRPQELDCFSLGCTIYVMLAGSHPFSRWDEVTEDAWLKSSGDDRVDDRLRPALRLRLNKRDKNVAKKILNGIPPFAVDLAHIDKDAVDLVRRLLSPAPRFRLTIRAACRQAWVAKSKSELENLYSRNVRGRQDREE